MVFEELASKANAQLRALDSVLKNDVTAFNKLVRDRNVPAIVLRSSESAGGTEQLDEDDDQ
jgi:hypothetical protein